MKRTIFIRKIFFEIGILRRNSMIDVESIPDYVQSFLRHEHIREKSNTALPINHPHAPIMKRWAWPWPQDGQRRLPAPCPSIIRPVMGTSFRSFACLLRILFRYRAPVQSTAKILLPGSPSPALFMATTRNSRRMPPGCPARFISVAMTMPTSTQSGLPSSRRWTL